VKVGGFTATRKFISPNYRGALKLDTKPDYRSTIYWNPSVTTNVEKGEATFYFFAADSETTYRVVVEGVTARGGPSCRIFIQVIK